jgi:hypothetical protein
MSHGHTRRSSPTTGANRLRVEWWLVITDVVAALTDSVALLDYLKNAEPRPVSERGFPRGGTACSPSSVYNSKRQADANFFSAGTRRHVPPDLIGFPHHQTCSCSLPSQRYAEAWIEKRRRSVAVFDELTGEWDKRGTKEQRDYSISPPKSPQRLSASAWPLNSKSSSDTPST